MDPLEPVLDQMEELLRAVEELPPPDRDRVFALLDGIDTLHRRALRQLDQLLPPDTVAAFRAEGGALAWLCDAYGLGVDERTAADAALEEMRPYIHSHGGRVELLDVTDGVVRLRMSGSCAGCSASAMTLTDGIEEALRRHLPGFVSLEAEQDDAPAHPPPGPVLVRLRDGPPPGWP